MDSVTRRLKSTAMTFISSLPDRQNISLWFGSLPEAIHSTRLQLQRCRKPLPPPYKGVFERDLLDLHLLKLGG